MSPRTMGNKDIRKDAESYKDAGPFGKIDA